MQNPSVLDLTLMSTNVEHYRGTTLKNGTVFVSFNAWFELTGQETDNDSGHRIRWLQEEFSSALQTSRKLSLRVELRNNQSTMFTKISGFILKALHRIANRETPQERMTVSVLFEEGNNFQEINEIWQTSAWEPVINSGARSQSSFCNNVENLTPAQQILLPVQDWSNCKFRVSIQAPMIGMGYLGLRRGPTSASVAADFNLAIYPANDQRNHRWVNKYALEADDHFAFLNAQCRPIMEGLWVLEVDTTLEVIEELRSYLYRRTLPTSSLNCNTNLQVLMFSFHMQVKCLRSAMFMHNVGFLDQQTAHALRNFAIANANLIYQQGLLEAADAVLPQQINID